MLLNYAQAFTILSADMEKVRYQILLTAAQEQWAELNVEHEKVQYLLQTLRNLVATCQQVPQLDRMLGPLGRLIARIEGKAGLNELTHAVDAIQLQLFDELNRLKLYHVPSNLAALYEDLQPLSADVFDAFPSAILDSRNAAKCLALGQPTACMFHLMRVLERGLTAYGEKLGVKYAPGWETYISRIQDQLGPKWNTKEKAWKSAEPIHKRILGDLTAMKIAWRNPTMHIVNDYTHDEALIAFATVKGFMQNLAALKVKEGRRKVARTA